MECRDDVWWLFFYSQIFVRIISSCTLSLFILLSFLSSTCFNFRKYAWVSSKTILSPKSLYSFHSVSERISCLLSLLNSLVKISFSSSVPTGVSILELLFFVSSSCCILLSRSSYMQHQLSFWLLSSSLCFKSKKYFWASCEMGLSSNKLYNSHNVSERICLLTFPNFFKKTFVNPPIPIGLVARNWFIYSPCCQIKNCSTRIEIVFFLFLEGH